MIIITLHFTFWEPDSCVGNADLPPLADEGSAMSQGGAHLSLCRQVIIVSHTVRRGFVFRKIFERLLNVNSMSLLSYAAARALFFYSVILLWKYKYIIVYINTRLSACGSS